MIHPARGAAAAALCVLALAGAFAAQAATAPVALVMQVTGKTDPPLARHREVPEGSIKLGPQSKVALLHYVSCKIVTVNGGTANVTSNDVEAPAANVESSKAGPCPRVHKIVLSEGTASGGVSVSRAVSIPNNAAPINMAANATVVLTGAPAARAVSYELRDGFDRRVVAPVPIKDGTFVLDGKQGANGPTRSPSGSAIATSPPT